MDQEELLDEIPDIDDLDASITDSMIADRISWNQYIALKKSAMSAPTRFAIIDGKRVDLFRAGPYIKRHIDESVAEYEERQRLSGLVSFFRSQRQRCIALRKKALGESVASAHNEIARHTPELIDLFGQFYSASDIRQICLKKYGFTVAEATLRSFQVRWANQISAAREKHKKDLTTVRLSHKKSRLEELQKLYNDRHRRYENAGNREDYKLLLQTLEQIRKEVDGDKLQIDINGEINVNVAINDQIRSEVMRDISLIEIIVARVAARRNVNPMLLMARLRQSIYSKFTGLAPVSSTPQDEPVVYPSSFVYDFDAIRKLTADKDQELNQQQLSVPEAEVVSVQTTTLKDEIIRRLREQQQS